MPAYPKPPEVEFPETLLGAWMRLRRIKQERLAKALGVSQQQACRYCKPRNHKYHNRPGPEQSDRLREWTGGAIHAGNFADTWQGGDIPPAPPEEQQAPWATQAAPADPVFG